MLRKVVFQFFRGFGMGSADVVPGVSGGTIALVLGIYTEVIRQVRQGARVLSRVVRGDVRGGWEELGRLDLAFLLPLLAGIGAAVLTLASFIEHALEEEPVRTAAVFFGLVAGSIIVTARNLREVTLPHLAVLAGAAAVTFVVLGFRSGPVDEPALVFVFLAGAVSICAMILPGISGSFLLLMFGMYDYVLGAVNERELDVIATFGVGAVLGLATFSSLLHWALDRHESIVMMAMVGLMAGSLRVLWPWPDGTAGTTMSGPSGDVLMPIVLAGVAFVAVIALAAIAHLTQTDVPDPVVAGITEHD